MRGVWLEDGKLRARDDLPRPDPPAGECLVRVSRAGICNTDLELLRGYYPFAGVLGHEFVGSVLEGPPELRGCRVVGEINASCGDCRACAAGRRRHCARRTVLGIVGRDGAFAELLSLPAENLHPVPAAVDDDAAIFTEPLAAAVRILEQVAPEADDRVLVVGDGKLGQLVAQALATTPCDLQVLGRHRRKLRRLRRLGIDATGSDEGIDGRFDIAVDCAGNPGGFATARRALRPLGTLVLKSTYAGELTVDASSLVVDELRVLGSRCGPFPPALRLLEDGLEVTSLIDARYPLPRAVDAFEHAARRGALKIVLEMR